MSASHARAQRLEDLRIALSVLIAISGLAAAFTTTGTAPITLIGAAWAVAYSAGFVSWTKRELRRAALLQEMFDVRLFRIQWNPVLAGEELGAQEVNQFSKRCRARPDMLRNYYEIPDLPRPYDVLACQQQNLGWGSRARRRYAHAVLATITVWAILGLVIGAIASLTVPQLLLRWYLPSLGMFLLGLDIFRSQRDVAAERDRALALTRSHITTAANSGEPTSLCQFNKHMILARHLQDILFLSRVRVPRVPDWFFLRFRPSDRSDFQAAMDELEIMLKGHQSQ